MDRARSAALLAVAVLGVAGCGGARDVAKDGPAAGGTETTTPASSTPDGEPRSPCLTPATESSRVVSVDWADFLVLNGTEYFASYTGRVPPVGPDQLGPVVGSITCEVSVLTFSDEPGRSVDGDAGFLPVGTEVHAVEGFDPSCRVAAEVDGENRVYLAQAKLDEPPGAVPCAKAPRRQR